MFACQQLRSCAALPTQRSDEMTQTTFIMTSVQKQTHSLNTDCRLNRASARLCGYVVIRRGRRMCEQVLGVFVFSDPGNNFSLGNDVFNYAIVMLYC